MEWTRPKDLPKANVYVRRPGMPPVLEPLKAGIRDNDQMHLGHQPCFQTLDGFQGNDKRLALVGEAAWGEHFDGGAAGDARDDPRLGADGRDCCTTARNRPPTSRRITMKMHMFFGGDDGSPSAKVPDDWPAPLTVWSWLPLLHRAIPRLLRHLQERRAVHPGHDRQAGAHPHQRTCSCRPGESPQARAHRRPSAPGYQPREDLQARPARRHDPPDFPTRWRARPVSIHRILKAGPDHITAERIG